MLGNDARHGRLTDVVEVRHPAPDATVTTLSAIMRPAGVVVSMFSVIDRKPAPAWAIRSMMEGIASAVR